MKHLFLCITIVMVTLSACKKDSTPAPPVDNGPISGAYTFTSCNVITNDTTVDLGFLVTTERTYTNQSCSGKLTITKTNIKSDGLIWNYGINSTEKRTNMSTNSATSSSSLPSSDSRGASSTSYNSDYTFSIPGSQLLINDGQYLFCPAFQIQPADKKYNYTASGNQLTVTVEYYSSTYRSRSLSTSVFTKN